jgi:hypothetical protein
VSDKKEKVSDFKGFEEKSKSERKLEFLPNLSLILYCF